MIEVSVVASELVTQRRAPLSIRFANTGRGSCSDIVFTLALPTGIVLVGGSERVEIAVIRAGHTYTREFAVQPKRPGRFELTSTNFSYRDERDVPVRVTDFRAFLVVAPPPPPTPVRQPVGRLGVEYEGEGLVLGSWDELRIVVKNGTGIALGDVTMTVEGPFNGDVKRSRVGALAHGARGRFAFRVNAAEAGRHVPVTVRTSYSYADAAGDARTKTQVDTISVIVRPVAPPTATPPAERTILYLAASPRTLPRLRSDLEMRKVKERLQLGKVGHQYRIEPALAARFGDISQALMDHEPQVLHFSGHGDQSGNLCLEDDNGNSDLITPEGLAALIGQHRATIRCVILNACYSIRLAKALAEKIEYVIGMRYQIEDDAAIEFSFGFYVGLFGGQSIPDAFDRGVAHILARPATGPDHLKPLIFPPGPVT